MLCDTERLAGDGEEVPGARHSFELMLTAISKCEAGPCQQVFDRPRDNDFATVGYRRHSGTYVHREPANPLPSHLDFASMNPSPDREPDPSQGIANSTGTADSPTRSIERHEEAVAGGVHLVPPSPCKLAPHNRIMLIQ